MQENGLASVLARPFWRIIRYATQITDTLCCCCMPSETYGRNGVTPIFRYFHRTIKLSGFMLSTTFTLESIRTEHSPLLPHKLYMCLTDETKEFYEEYKMQFENDPFNSELTDTGNRLSDEIAKAQQNRCQTLIESTNFTHSSRKTWNTINKLSKDYAKPQQ